jgi:hypothetical protein
MISEESGLSEGRAMGGPGSGSHYHWWRSGKKKVVEHCLSLDVNRWARGGTLRAGASCGGAWRWTYPGGRESTVVYWLDTRDPDTSLVLLSYDLTVAGQERPQPVECPVRLTTTVPHFGGLRWWFLCPLVVNGHPCNRRVGKLYLPPGRRDFGCRHCHDLTYTSCQQHDKRVDRLRKDPEALLRLLAEDPENADPSRLILLLKALPL